jgi:hypothetical protein
METAETVEQEILLRGRRCKVIALRHRKTWRATGRFLGKEVEVHRAATPEQAFEWWRNKAGRQQPGD